MMQIPMKVRINWLLLLLSLSLMFGTSIFAAETLQENFDNDGFGWTGKFTYEVGTGYNNSNCISIENITLDDEDAKETITGLLPNTWYSLFGKIKGLNITGGEVGANFCASGTWYHSDEAEGTFDWRDVSFTFQTDATGTANIGCRLGYWGNACSGKAWFNEIAIKPLTRYDGKHIYLWLEEGDVQNNITTQYLQRWITHLDAVYDGYQDLVGAAPDNKDQIGIVSCRQYPGGWAIAGNPIFWFENAVGNELNDCNTWDNWSFGICHELGHDFDLDYRWVWNAEFFGSFKAVYANEQLGVIESLNLNGTNVIYQPGQLLNWYRENYDPNNLNWDAMIYRMVTIARTIGWDPYKQTFRYFNGLATADLPVSGGDKFTLFINKLSEYSHQNVLGMFTPGEYEWIKVQLLMYPAWSVGVNYAINTRVVYNNSVYQCIQSHTAQVGWEPSNVPALWQVVRKNSDWTPEVHYLVGDVITYNGQCYQCIQGHVSQLGWEPINVPALWKPY